jgi:hypothetical protein
MFNSQQYRIKAAEYQNRASKTHNPNEIREFEHLARTFGELADNAEWMEQNSAGGLGTSIQRNTCLHTGALQSD